MSNLLGSLAAAGGNFFSSGMNYMDPHMSENTRIALGLQSNALPQSNTDLQSVSKCLGDYSKMPYGWRPSPFMGQCGFKIELNKFYSASSPCYPIQDISCMGAVQKKAWANMCSTEFPCKPPVWPKLPNASGSESSTNQGDNFIESFIATFMKQVPLVIGVSLTACGLGGVLSYKQASKSGDESPEIDESSIFSK